MFKNENNKPHLTMQQAKTVLALAGLTLCVLPVVALVPGCGGGGGDNSINVNPFAGQYSGLLPANTFQSAVKITVQNDGSATFNQTVTSHNPGTVVIPSTLQGSVDQNGAFSFSGTIVVNGKTQTIKVQGTLPQNSTTSTSFTAQIGSQTFTGTITPLGSATPTPGPTATPGSTPTGSGGNGG
ncbi:MAG: hypothetical protein JO316_21975 [Abitibacteriaceae bacterium]|nr:hypothetical protein [Abditibacteriaceae bacterium]